MITLNYIHEVGADHSLDLQDPTPVVAVVGRNDLDGQDTGPFTRIFAVANHSTTDTRNDPRQNATCLILIGTRIGQ